MTKKKKKKKKKDKAVDRWDRMAVVIAAVLGIAGVIGSIGGQRDIRLGRETADWPSVDGVVEESTVSHRIRNRTEAEGMSGTETTYVLTVRYSYEVGGERFVSQRTGFGHEEASDDVSKIEALQQQNPPGARVTVFYDPDAPAVAVLRRGSSTTSLMVLAGASIAIGVAVMFMMNARPAGARRGKNRSTVIGAVVVVALIAIHAVALLF